MNMETAEYDPLLPIGRHRMSLVDLRLLCVAAFPSSRARPVLMATLEDLVYSLARVRLEMEVWVNGSFLTRKIEPDDVDLSVWLDGEQFDAAAEADVRAFAEALHRAKRRRCHIGLFHRFPREHPDYWEGEYDYCYWMRQWGFARDQTRKGIAVVQPSSEQGAMP